MDFSSLATPERITTLLVQAGLLERGQVVQVVSNPHTVAPFNPPRIAYLNLKYTPGTRCQAPERMVFKIGTGSKEFLFLQLAAMRMPAGCVPQVYAAQYESENDRTILLLEDLSRTHTQSDWPLPPSITRCEQAIDSLAKIHACWWEKPDLYQDLKPALAQVNNWQKRIELAMSSLEGFLDFIADRLSPDRRAIFEKLSQADAIWMPNRRQDNCTLLHGDAHFWNVLFARDEQTADVRWLDWNLWDCGRGTNDLAYMIGLHWYPERRKMLEKHLLLRYHSQLCQAGVAGYPWQAYWQDYRMSMIMNLWIPVWQWQRGIHPCIWWSHLERGFEALRDLNCEELV